MATTSQKNAADLSTQAIALAEQLGRIAGTIEGTAEAWLNRQSLTDQLTRVRDGAAEMLESLTSGAEKGRQAATSGVRNFTNGVRQTASQAVTAAGLGGRTAKARSKRKKASVVTASARTRQADLSHAPGKQAPEAGAVCARSEEIRSAHSEGESSCRRCGSGENPTPDRIARTGS